MGVPGPRLRSGFGTGCSCKVNKQPSRDGAALIWVGIVAGGTAVSATAAQGRVWEWVKGKKNNKIRILAGWHHPGKYPLLQLAGGRWAGGTWGSHKETLQFYGLSPAPRDKGVTLNTLWAFDRKKGHLTTAERI